MTTAAIYARVSTDEQANNYSLPSQLAYCREYCAKKGYAVAAEFQEDYTGTTLERPELDKVRDMAEAGAFSVLVVLEMDRLSREIAIQYLLEREFKAAGVGIEYVLEEYEDTPEGELKKGLRSVIAQYERLKFRQRAARGRMYKAKSGSVMAAKVNKYGYEIVKTGNDGRKLEYQPIPQEAAVVLSAFQWYTIGDETGRKLKTSDIARRFTEMGIPSRFDTLGGKFARNRRANRCAWQGRRILRILRDETYAGTAHYGQSKRLDVNGKKRQVKQDKSAWIPIPVPAIVPRDLWEATQRQIEANRSDPAANRRNNRHSLHLMRSRMTCARCGHLFQLNNAHRVRRTVGYYRCDGNRRSTSIDGKVMCSGIYPQEKIDAEIWEAFAERMKNPEYILESYRRDQADTEAHNAPIQARLAEVNRCLAELVKGQADLLDEHLKQHFPREMLETRAGELNASISSFKRERASLEARVRIAKIDDNALTGLLEYSEQFRNGLDNLTAEQKREVIEKFDLRGVVMRDGDNYCIEVSAIVPDTLIVTGSIKGSSIN